MLTPDTKIEKIIGIGPKIAKRLKKLGIEKVSDFLYHFPFRYDDFSKITPIAKMRSFGSYCIKAKVLEIKTKRSFIKRMFITTALLSDKTGSLKAIWYNQPFLSRILKKGQEVILAGKMDYGPGGSYLQNPIYEKSMEKTLHTGRLVPVYPETKGVNSKWLRKIIFPLLPLASSMTDFMPAEIKKNHHLINLDKALSQIHFPESREEIKQARARLGFDELFLIQLKLLKMKKNWQLENAPKIKFDLDSVKKLVKKLPFKLTNAQRKAAWQIIGDLSGRRQNQKQKTKNKKPKDQRISPMNRLLEGDVGSGKTVVAAIAMLVAAKDNFQSVLLAPTEILAIQHFNSLSKLLSGFDVSLGLLTSGKSELTRIKNYELRIKKKDLAGASHLGKGSGIALLQAARPTQRVVLAYPRPRSSDVPSETMPARAAEPYGEDTPHPVTIKKPDFIQKIKQGEVDIIIGTHALIQERIEFKKLGLAIVDEQHRFGVEQRAVLKKKGHLVPHLLSMTATPIPRTLSFALYGDLDISILDEMPPGRQKVATFVIPPEKRDNAYQFIRSEIKKGQQVFVICPLIDESDKLGVKSAKEEYQKLDKLVFPDLKIALLHGRMKTKEKEKVMADFKDKKYALLVSTAVVEVGVDVPNATVMMIEGAERFGLAQLHQFRGRVGRSQLKSYCFLFSEIASDKTFRRLNYMAKINDGFKLAEKDLDLRGPGELSGTMQHGFLDLKIASLRDYKTMIAAKKEAEKIIEKGLNNCPTLAKKLGELEQKITSG